MLEIYSHTFFQVLVAMTFAIIGSCIRIHQLNSNKKQSKINIIVRIIQDSMLGHIVGLVVYVIFFDKLFVISLFISAITGTLSGFFGLNVFQYFEDKIKEQEYMNTNKK